MIRQTLKKARDSLGRARLGVYAASGAYRLFLSLWPMAMLFLSLLPYTPLTRQQLLDVLLLYAPDTFRQLVSAIAGELYQSAAAVGLGAATALWSAGKFLSGLMDAVAALYGQTRPGGLRGRFLGALYTGGLILIILLLLALLLFGRRLLALAELSLPRGAVLWRAILKGRAVIFLAGVAGANCLLFCRIPRPGRPLRPQLPGAIGAAAVWLLFSQGYSLAVERFRFFSLYGSMAIVIISLFWLYCSLYILLFGAWFNRFLAENREKM